MSVATAPVLSLAPTPELIAPMFRLSIHKYHAMIEAGILTKDDPVELLEGYLVVKMPKNPPHTFSTGSVFDALYKLIPHGWMVRVQDPITFAESEPEPDVAVVRGAWRDYAERHPEPGEVALVIEVAHATLSIDRKWKKRLYAAAGIPVYWVVNLQENVIEVYTEPATANETADYQQQQNYSFSDTLPVILDGEAVGNLAVADLLP